jgi:hemerythrin
MRKNTPFTITNRIAEALGLPDTHMADAIQTTRYKAVAEIVSSFLNYTEKHDKGQQGFFAGMIIRILLPNDKSVHFSDMQTVINIIQKGDKAIQEEMKQEREDWLAARKTDKELATA